MGRAAPRHIVTAITRYAWGACLSADRNPRVILHFTGSAVPVLQGDSWKVIFVQEGVAVDKRYNVTRASIEQAVADKLFDNIYVQELLFRDGTAHHLPKELESTATGGVFGNVVGVTINSALEILEDGKAAIVGYIEAIDEAWKTRMLKLFNKGLKLPGLSFNATIAKNDLIERIITGGKQLLDILKFQQIDTMDVVSYPNAGGQILRAVAGEQPAEETPSPSLLHDDRTSKPMKTKLVNFLASRGLPTIDGTETEILQAAIASPHFASLQAAEQDMLQALQELIGKELTDTANRLVSALQGLIQQKDPNAEDPAKEEEQPPKPPSDQPSQPPQPPKKAEAGLEVDRQLASFEDVAAQFMSRLEAKLNSRVNDFDATLRERERMQAGRQLIQQSTLPDSLKPLAVRQFETTKNGDAAMILQEFGKAVAPLQQQGRVRASVSNGGLSFGMDSKRKKEIAVIKMLGGKASNDKEAGEFQQVRGFRGLVECLGETTGVWVNRLSLDEFNKEVSTRRMTADIDMFETSDFPNLLGNTMNRVLIELFGEKDHSWEEIVTIRTGVKDFRDNRMNRIAGFSAPLPVYTDTGTGKTTRYDNPITLVGSPAEQEGTWRPKIRAMQWILGYEAMVNDDINAVQTFLKDFADAAEDTALYVAAQVLINADANGVINGGTIYDTKALYHADHKNLMTEEFSFEAVKQAMALIRKQRRMGSGGRPISLRPEFIIVPEALNDACEVMLTTDKRPQSSENDTNTVAGKLKQITFDEYWLGDVAASSKNWFVMSDPKKNAAIEMGFLFDDRNPRIITQNAPTEGLMFSHLETTFSGVYVLGAGLRAHECVVASLPA